MVLNIHFIEILHVSITQWNATSESMTHLCHFSNFRHVNIIRPSQLALIKCVNKDKQYVYLSITVNCVRNKCSRF
jgi:hypothetical protein